MLLGHEDLRNFRSPSYLSSGFALELGDKSVEARLVGLNANNGKELLDVGSGGGGVATGLEEEVCSNVTHLEKKNRRSWSAKARDNIPDPAYFEFLRGSDEKL